jgi:hypothetical protein
MSRYQALPENLRGYILIIKKLIDSKRAAELQDSSIHQSSKRKKELIRD